MQVAVLEWICGGGLVDEPPEQIPAGLRAEGGAMLCTLVEGMHAGGVEVSVAIDRRLISPTAMDRLGSQASITDVSGEIGCDLTATWNRLSQACDLTLVVAPEIDHALLHVTEMLRGQGASLINCSADFIAAAGDKLATARVLHARSIHHPPTRRLADVDGGWMHAARVDAKLLDVALPWVVKPIDGAGGDGQRLCSDEDLLQLQTRFANPSSGRNALRKLLVQPRLRGRPYSCSAIVDTAGRCHWLPLVSQDFAVTQEPGQPPKYAGCSMAAPANRVPAPVEILDATIAALGSGAQGWIGVDLLYCDETRRWCVIDVNPRCTTSMVGLTQAYSGNLVMELLQASQGQLDRLCGSWNDAATYRIE